MLLTTLALTGMFGQRIGQDFSNVVRPSGYLPIKFFRPLLTTNQTTNFTCGNMRDTAQTILITSINGCFSHEFLVVDGLNEIDEFGNLLPFCPVILVFQHTGQQDAGQPVLRILHKSFASSKIHSSLRFHAFIKFAHVSPHTTKRANKKGTPIWCP